jgi:hypothetical protein
MLLDYMYYYQKPTHKPTDGPATPACSTLRDGCAAGNAGRGARASPLVELRPRD